MSNASSITAAIIVSLCVAFLVIFIIILIVRHVRMKNRVLSFYDLAEDVIDPIWIIRESETSTPG